MPVLKLTSIPAFSAIYYALLQNGYEFSKIERDVAAIQKLNEFSAIHEEFPYFTHVKQNSCEVYPYWPRAALLETASFFIDSEVNFRNIPSLRRMIYAFDNITDCDRDDTFWTWLMDFPAALRTVLNSPGFQSYSQWENTWIKKQNQTSADELNKIQNALNAIQQIVNTSSLQQIEIVISPIKCVYSADYHLIDGRFIFSSGSFTASSVIHEYLHPVVHPFVQQRKKEILKKPRIYHGLDPSYYLNGSEDGLLNAFEEALVRSITSILLEEKSIDLYTHIDQMLS